MYIASICTETFLAFENLSRIIDEGTLQHHAKNFGGCCLWLNDLKEKLDVSCHVVSSRLSSMPKRFVIFYNSQNIS